MSPLGRYATSIFQVMVFLRVILLSAKYPRSENIQFLTQYEFQTYHKNSVEILIPYIVKTRKPTMFDYILNVSASWISSAEHYGLQKIIFLLMLLAGAISALQAWYKGFKNLQAVRDTPTSQIASAAQGYTELSGTAKAFNSLIECKLRRKPCIWFSYKIEKQKTRHTTDSDGHSQTEHYWETVDEGKSNQKFILEDGTGRCIIDPVGADIKSRHSECWTEGDMQYTESVILENEPLYAIGNFHTQHKRVGTLGLQEKELDAHFMSATVDGRPYLIWNAHEDQILDMESFGSKLGLWIFLGLLLLIWILHQFWGATTPPAPSSEIIRQSSNQPNLTMPKPLKGSAENTTTTNAPIPDTETSTSCDVAVNGPPQIDQFEPSSAKIGDFVSIHGSNFGCQEDHIVSIGGNGISVELKVIEWRSDQIKAHIPNDPRLQTKLSYYFRVERVKINEAGGRQYLNSSNLFMFQFN